MPFCFGVFGFVYPHGSFDGMCFAPVPTKQPWIIVVTIACIHTYFWSKYEELPQYSITILWNKAEVYYLQCIWFRVSIWCETQRFCSWLMVHIYQHCNFPSWFPVVFSYQGYDPGCYQSLEIDHMDDSLYLVEASSVTRFHEKEVTQY